MEQNDVFIVIPAFNEASRIGPVLQELRQLYQQVIVVDDGSTDGTATVAEQHDCVLLRHSINRGQGAALQTGIAYSLRRGAGFLVTFDADGQHQAADIAKMLAPVVGGEVDVTLGSRFLGSSSNVPFVRRLVLQAARVFTWLTSGLYLSDCHNGFRVLSRAAAEKIKLRQDRMAHASEFYDQIRLAQLTYKEVSVSIRYTPETLAKGQSLSNSVNILFNYLFGKVSR